MSMPTAATRAPVNGLDMYYEIHGEGEPLVMLHGGVVTNESFGPNLAELAKTRQVIVPHMQAHGHTPDIDRPITYEAMADDVAALLAHLGIGKADFLGISMGGGVALQAAIRHPEIVGRLVVVSATMSSDGSYPEVVEKFPPMIDNAPQIAAGLKQSPLAKLYPDTDWEVIFRKMGAMEAAGYDWSAEVAKIEAPTLLVFADADSIMPQHMVELWTTIGGGQRDAGLDGSRRPRGRLAIIPGATHYDIMTTTSVSVIAEQFLAAELPLTAAE